MNCSTAFAKPSSSLLVVTRLAARWTSWLGIAHRDGQSRVGEHQYVVGHVADRGDLVGGNLELG